CLVPYIAKPQMISASGSESPAFATLGERMDFVAGFLRRRYLIILASLLLSLSLGAFYFFKTPPTYTASSTILIEPPRKGLLQQTPGGDPPPDAAWIESQIGVLKSQNVASYVIKQLRLVEDPQFIRSGDELIDKLLAGLDQLLARLGWQAEPKT